MAAFVTQGNFNDALNFINRVIALPVDGDGYIGLHNTYVPKEQRKKPKAGKMPFGFGMIANDPDDFIQKMRKMFTGKWNRDIYVCMGTQSKYMQKRHSQTGEVQFVPDRHRENISRLRSLYIDVDFKGGKHGYPSEAEADTAINKFLADCGLPAPNVVVHTGGGFHLYWVFNRALPVADWQVMANQLAEATRHHGFKCDTACTVDATRVLRVPNTFNYKYDPERSVKVHRWLPDDFEPDDIGTVLGKYVAQNVTPQSRLPSDMAAFVGVKPFQPFQSTEEMTELGDGCVDSPPIDLKHVYQNCGFIRDTLKDGGANMVGQPLWNLATLLTVFTKQGRGAAHMMASQNQFYVADEQDKLYDRKVQERERGVGWPRCSTIKAAGATQCDTCPHLSKGLYPFSFLSSPAAPLSVGATMPLQAPEMPAEWLALTGEDILPSGFQRDEKRLIYKVSTGDEGNFELYPSPSSILSDAYISHDPMTLHFKAQVTLFSQPRWVDMPNRHIKSVSIEMTNILGDAGVAFDDKNAMADFMGSWVEKLKESRKTQTEHHPYGWAEDANGVTGFAYAGKLYTPEGTYIAKAADPELAKQYHPQGDIEKWKQVAKLVTDTKRPAMDAILAAAFAAPLVYFTGEEGFYLGVFSEDSGVGKTTAMRVAQSVWGNPSALQRLNDTTASVQQKMGALRHLPIAWDELKGDDQLREMAKMIFDLNSGRSKSRLTTDAKQRGTVEWKTLLVTASNNSMADHLNELAKNDAGAYRLFELQAEPMSIGKVSLADAGTLRRLLDTNFGVAGERYAAYIGANYRAIAEQVKRLQAKLEADCQIEQPERNWLHTSVVLIMGAALANQCGLTDIDVPALKARLLEEINGMRQVISETPLRGNDPRTVAAQLTKYLYEHSHQMVITSDIYQKPGKPPAGAVTLLFPIGMALPTSIVGQYGQACSTLRLAKGPLEDWLRKNKVAQNVFKHVLHNTFKAVYHQKKTIAGGIPGLRVQEPVYDLDLSLQSEFTVDDISNIITSNNVVPIHKP